MFQPRQMMRLSLLPLAMILAIYLGGCGSDGPTHPIDPGTTDQAPPVPPDGARIDWQMHGKFALAWDRNTEPDLAGYRVYLYAPDPVRGNSYTLISGDRLLTKNTLTVSATDGTSYIFRVTAVDASNNESAMGGPLSYSYSASVGGAATEGLGGLDSTPGSSGSGSRSGSNETPMEQGGNGGW